VQAISQINVSLFFTIISSITSITSRQKRIPFSFGQDALRAPAKLPTDRYWHLRIRHEGRARRVGKEGNNYSMTECAYRTRTEVARRLSGHRSNQLQCCAKCSLPADADGDGPAHQRNSIGNQWNSPKTPALLIPSGLNSTTASYSSSADTANTVERNASSSNPSILIFPK